MRRYTPICFLVLTLVAGSGCSSKQATESKKAPITLDRIQGKAQVLIESGGAMDVALNAGNSSSTYIWEGSKRYRLFLKKPFEATHGDQYVVEGINAQRVIDEIGDPDQGKNGYPLLASCRRVITAVWKDLAFDQIDLNAEVLRVRVQRYPARAVFLVTRIQQVESKEGGSSAAAKKGVKAKEKEIPEVEVPGAKQSALLIATPPVQTAPLWDPKAEAIACKVIIGPDGNIGELLTGKQLCEFVDWSKYNYQPPTKAGHPVKVCTEVEVKFKPREQPAS
jgi:hypothetical protein